MRIWLNEFELNNSANRVYLDEPIEGLDLPSIRTSKGVNTGQSGGYIGAQFYDPRAVTLTGRIHSQNVSQALQKRRDIQSHLPIHPSTITVRVLDDDGRSYTFDTYLIDFKMPINRSRLKSVFKIELEAPDEVIYDITDGSLLTTTINQMLPGGVQFTTVDPLFDSFYFSAGDAAATVTNANDVTTYPTITITGAITDPTFINRTTGESFSLSGYAVGADAVTVINMAKHTVTLNGGNAFAYVPLSANWWGLVPGDNPIEFTSGGGSTAAVLTWRPGVRGI